jgi:hypothetical protein
LTQTHYFDGDIRIGHCGGVDIKAINELVSVLGLLLNRSIDWDTETLGCFSPRSHRLADVFGEISQFLVAPGNEREARRNASRTRGDGADGGRRW